MSSHERRRTLPASNIPWSHMKLHTTSDLVADIATLKARPRAER